MKNINDLTSFKWATVTSTGPLQIRLDGDSSPLAMVPDSLVDPLSLAVNDRVRVELSNRKAIIHGKSGGDMPSGSVIMSGAGTAPAGWLLCQGQSLLRADYPALFLALGTAYGSASSLHFSLPDLRGKIVAGVDTADADFNARGKTGGSKTNVHNHWTGQGGDATTQYNAQTADLPRTRTRTTTRSVATAASASGNTRETSTYDETINVMQPYVTMQYIIKI
ncbi:minor tail protein [Microbacterium phage Morrigan]|nr:minor tail protein [Microbacterium phage Morrigan]